ncbi:MAG: SAM-dependent methyltransferase [Novosphingobium sp.]|nr:SAM-dependent methyltransferase [Novosphingobium sp.]
MSRAAALRPFALAVLAFVAVAGCEPAPQDNRPESSRGFPRADRPVSKIVSTEFSNENDRDDRNEANTVMDLAGIGPGLSVADIGAGEGYYTVRLAERVGRKGRVLAQDIDGDALRRLGSRVEKDRLDNVSIKPGAEDDPRLPERSFDRVFMVHMYHEVAEPYAFLWRLWPSLKPGGRVVVVDVDRSTAQHGIPPALLFCEMEAAGFRLDEFHRKPEIAGYYAQFVVAPVRPEPASIKPCRLAPAKGVSAQGR